VRIHVACGWPRPVGAVVHAGRLAGALHRAGHAVQAVAAQPAGGPPMESGMLIVPFERAPGADPLAATMAAVHALVAASSATEGDVGHAQDPVAAAALLDLRRRGRLRAVVTTVHHLASHDRGEVEDLQRRAVQEADATICPSRWWAGRIRSEFGVEPVVVPHGVERDRFSGVAADRAEAGRLFGWGDRPVVLTLGGVQPRKGSRVLLEAFARARARIGGGALLVVAGPAEHADFREAWLEDAARLGLTVGRGPAVAPEVDVVELGAVPGPDMPLLLRACDALASPSTREGFGLAPLEAAAAGVPNVVSDLPVFREHFTDGRDALVVPVGDSGPLAMALVRVLRDAALRAALLEGGHALARRFDWSACARAHEGVYEEVLARVASGG
jgi:glycosyltransferase involved in cell wall biosynthesis